jgi:outer membrane protein assembly factor BamA
MLSLSKYLIFKLLIIFLLIYSNTFGTETASKFIVSSISISGNKITNEVIILRELTFKLGDTIYTTDIPFHTKESKENLENTLLFNFVTLSLVQDINNVLVEITVEERWYVWPFPIFEYADRNLSSFIKEGDYRRINYGGYVRINNFRGMGDQIRFRLIGGYRQQIGVQYSTRNLDRLKKHGLSASVTYHSNYEVPFASFNNKPVYFNTHNGRARWIFHTDFTYQYRPKHNWYHSISIGTLLAGINDTIAKLNPNYFGNNKTQFAINQIRYELTLDKRNSKVFPLSGYLGRFEIARQGITPNESIKLWYTKVSGGYYFKLLSRIYGGVDFLAKQSSKSNLPYFLNEAIGFKDYIRGYEYYVTNGSGFLINKNSIKFELLPTRVVNLPLVPDGKFKKTNLSIYWSLFADTGYVKPDNLTPNNNLEGKLLYGFGSGLYLFAYYDIVFRVEYSVNIFGEGGIFVHFGSPFLNN